MDEIMALKNAPVEELLRRYKELYGEDAAGSHKLYLWRKIAYKLQEREHGSLSAKANCRIKALIEEYDPINNKALLNIPEYKLRDITKELDWNKQQGIWNNLLKSQQN